MEKNAHSGTGGPVFFRRRDLLVAAVLLAAAAVWLAVTLLTGRGGGFATATYVRDEAAAPVEIDLSRDGVYHIGADLPVTLEVRDGAVQFIDSVCPDHLCEEMGWLRNEGEWAACLPAGVMVRVTAESEDG